MNGPRPAARLRALVALALTAALGVTPGLAASSSGAAPEPGSPGVGDPYFPLDGNGGIDVQHYDIRARYDFGSGRLQGRTVVTLVPTAELSRFNLDLLLTARRVTVDGQVARHRRTDGHELVIRPAAALQPGATVRVVVDYAGRPARERYAGESNWLADDREVVTMNQPHMAPWWFPANDHPTDKATFDVSVSVPQGHQVVSGGELVEKRTKRGSTTWHWRSDQPMASYLAYFAAGRFDIESGVSDGLPWTLAVSRQLPPRDRAASMKMLRRTPSIVDALEQDLGDYPFSSTGGIVTSLSPGFALENQTRPTYPTLGPGDDWLLVHELAHQWFGDSVAVSRWRDIWLNEGAATFMEQRHVERRGSSAREWLAAVHRDTGPSSPMWRLPIGDPGRNHIFDDAVYTRGAMTFQALRNRIGEDDFWAVLRGWLAAKRDGHGTSEEFEAHAAAVSGEDLTGFFRAWLREPVRPEATTENGLG